jgi:flagellar biosynthetic protein FliR
MPGVFMLACATFNPHTIATLPSDALALLGAVSAEFLLGFAIGLVPFMFVAGVQTAGQLATTSMGLSLGNMIDPTLGVATSDLARILGDLAIIVFLALGGHHVVIQAVAGLGGTIVPGQFTVGPSAIELLIDRSGDIFRVGVMLSAPIMVALFLTNVVMGLISKAVPQVNIFVVSFPLTIGIGLVITVLALPDMVRFIGRELTGVETSIAAVTQSATLGADTGVGQPFDAAGQSPGSTSFPNP